jgi:hypothetical protein
MLPEEYMEEVARSVLRPSSPVAKALNTHLSGNTSPANASYVAADDDEMAVLLQEAGQLIAMLPKVHSEEMARLVQRPLSPVAKAMHHRLSETAAAEELIEVVYEEKKTKSVVTGERSGSAVAGDIMVYSAHDPYAPNAAADQAQVAEDATCAHNQVRRVHFVDEDEGNALERVLDYDQVPEGAAEEIRRKAAAELVAHEKDAAAAAAEDERERKKRHDDASVVAAEVVAGVVEQARRQLLDEVAADVSAQVEAIVGSVALNVTSLLQDIFATQDTQPTVDRRAPAADIADAADIGAVSHQADAAPHANVGAEQEAPAEETAREATRSTPAEVFCAPIEATSVVASGAANSEQGLDEVAADVSAQVEAIVGSVALNVTSLLQDITSPIDRRYSSERKFSTARRYSDEPRNQAERMFSPEKVHVIGDGAAGMQSEQRAAPLVLDGNQGTAAVPLHEAAAAPPASSDNAAARVVVTHEPAAETPESEQGPAAASGAANSEQGLTSPIDRRYSSERKFSTERRYSDEPRNQAERMFSTEKVHVIGDGAAGMQSERSLVDISTPVEVFCAPIETTPVAAGDGTISVLLEEAGQLMEMLPEEYMEEVASLVHRPTSPVTCAPHAHVSGNAFPAHASSAAVQDGDMVMLLNEAGQLLAMLPEQYMEEVSQVVQRPSSPVAKALHARLSENASPANVSTGAAVEDDEMAVLFEEAGQLISMLPEEYMEEVSQVVQRPLSPVAKALHHRLSETGGLVPYGGNLDGAVYDANLDAAAVKIQAIARGKNERKRHKEKKAKHDIPHVTEEERTAAEMAANQAFADLDAAAVKIQSIARGKAERKKHKEHRQKMETPVSEAQQAAEEMAANAAFTDLDAAAVKIQAIARGKTERKRHRERKVERAAPATKAVDDEVAATMTAAQMEEAAVKIQSRARGINVRRHRHTRKKDEATRHLKHDATPHLPHPNTPSSLPPTSPEPVGLYASRPPAPVTTPEPGAESGSVAHEMARFRMEMMQAMARAEQEAERRCV